MNTQKLREQLQILLDQAVEDHTEGNGLKFCGDLLLEAVEVIEQIESGRVYLDGKPGKTPKTRARQYLAKLKEKVGK